MENIMCRECKKSIVLQEDYTEGDLICTECGLVLDSHFVDFRQEWRTSNLDLSSESQARAEKPPNASFNNAEIFTKISKPKAFHELGCNDKNSDIMNLGKKYNVPNHRLIEGFNTISTIADKLALVNCITDHAREILKVLDDSESLRGLNNNLTAISCLYIACQLENNDRTFKEIVAVANVCTKLKTVSHTKKRISEALQHMGYPLEKVEMKPTIYARRTCSHLQINKTDVKAILETIDNLNQKVDIRHKPIVINATAIFMITQLSSDKRSLVEIAKATMVSKKTILATYKEILPFTKAIVPQWFQNQLKSTSLLDLSVI